MLYNGFMADLQPLSRKHQVVLENYLVSWHQTKSYLVAYPSASETVARTMASRLFADANFQAHIKARLSEMHMSADEALARMTDIAKANIGDFYTGFGDDLELALFEADGTPKKNTGLIKRIKIKRSARGDVETELELHSAQRAQEKILELNGKFGNLTKEPVNDSALQQTTGAFYLPADVIAPSFSRPIELSSRANTTSFASMAGAALQSRVLSAW